jgi:uncharacterized protein YdcH (DUF465 family)
MNKENLITIAGIAVIFVIISLVGNSKNSEHPTLNEAALLPDKYLENVSYYEKLERFDKSAMSLGKAIEAIWKIQLDVDDDSFNHLEEVIRRLEAAHSRISKDSAHMSKLNEDFNYALTNLAKAELEIAEMYAEVHSMKKAKLALKYAQLHIKNAMLYHAPVWQESKQNLAVEENVIIEIDSLITSDVEFVADYVLKIDQVMKEVDQLIAEQ